MTFYEQLIALSFELYDINSNFSLNIHADMIDIVEGNKVIVSIWNQGGKLYPTVRDHNTNTSIAIDLDEVLDILNIVKSYEERETE